MIWERVLLIALGVILGNAIRDLIAWCVDKNGEKPFIEDEEVVEVKLLTPKEFGLINVFDGTELHPIKRCEDCPYKPYYIGEDKKKGEAE